jgi:dimethylglycine dehydrogenase
MERMPELYAAICEAGAEYDIADFGVYAVNSLRMEKCYRGMGADLTNEISPIEAGLERFVSMKKGAFVGREALENIQRKGVALKLVYLEIDALDADCMGGEPIHANGRVVGVTTSGGFGHRVQKSLAFAYVEPEFADLGSQFEVEVLENRCKATVLESEPAYDPANERLRA